MVLRKQEPRPRGTYASCGFWHGRPCALLKRARQEQCVFLLTSTYMEVGDSEIASGNRVTGMLVCVRQVQTASEMSFKGTPNYYTQFLKDGACDLCSV